VRVLVLGGSGFVGPFVVRQLLDAGDEVLMFHRGSREPAMTADAEHVHGEFGALTDHLPRLRAWRPKVVVDVSPGIGKCGHGVLHFAGAVDHAVVLTSHDVYRAMDVLWGTAPATEIQPMPVDETSALRAGPSPDLAADWGFDNLVVERAVRSDPRLAATILRLPMIYGPLDQQRRLRHYVRRIDDGRDIVLDARLAGVRFGRGYVENVAAAVVLAIRALGATPKLFNVSEPDALTEVEWVREIGAACDWNGEVRVVDPSVLPPALRVPVLEGQHLFSTGALIRAELGFDEPVARAEGIGRAVEWERAQQASEPRPEYSDEDRVLRAYVRE